MLSKMMIVAAVLLCSLQQASCFLRSPPPMLSGKWSRTIATPNSAMGFDDFAVTVEVPRTIFNLFTKRFDFSIIKNSVTNVLYQMGFIESTSAVMPMSWALSILGFGALAMFLHATKDDKFKHPYVEGAAVYDPVLADKFYRSHPRLVLGRVFKILRLALGFNVRLLRDWRFGLMRDNQEARADELVDLLTQMGPTYIKLGQALSIRTDIVPPVYANSLKRLQDAVPAFPTKLARQIICSELGITELSEIFDEFSPEAVAAASIGQVYRATLKDGREVAVKVQRPNVLPSIGLDLYVMRKLAPLQTVVSNKLSGMTTEPADVDLAYSLVDEWGKGLVAEVDYLLEAENTVQFSKAMLSRGLHAVISPEVVTELCTQKIMVTQWITGTRLDRDCSADVPRLCGLAVNAYLTMLLDTGVLHCDPHPGNLLRTEDGRLCVLDWGMTLTLPQDLQYSLLEFIAHCNSEDYSHLAEDFVKLGATPPDKIDAVRRSGIPEGFAFIMNQLSAGGGPSQVTGRLRTEFKAKYGDDLSDAELGMMAREGMINSEMMAAAEGLETVDVSGVTGILEMMSKRNREIFKLPAYMLYVARAFSTLEGIGLSLDPKYSILQECYPYLAKRLMTDNAPRSRQALRDMLYQDGKLKADKLIEFSEGFTSYTAITAASDGNEGSRKAQQAFADLLLDSEGNLIQELLIDGAAQFTDSLARVGLDRLRNSMGGKMIKSALKTPKTLLDMITPPSLKALTLPLTLPYDFVRAAANLGESDDTDVENVKSVTLIWKNISPAVRGQLKDRVTAAVNSRSKPRAPRPRAGLFRRRRNAALQPSYLSPGTGTGLAVRDDKGSLYVPLSSSASDRIRARLGRVGESTKRLPVVMRLSRQLGANMLSNTAGRMEGATRTFANGEHEDSLEWEIELLFTESLSSFSAATANAIAKVLDKNVGTRNM